MHSQPLVSEFPRLAPYTDYEEKYYNELVFAEINGRGSIPSARTN